MTNGAKRRNMDDTRASGRALTRTALKPKPDPNPGSLTTTRPLTSGQASQEVMGPFKLAFRGGRGMTAGMAREGVVMACGANVKSPDQSRSGRRPFPRDWFRLTEARLLNPTWFGGSPAQVEPKSRSLPTPALDSAWGTTFGCGRSMPGALQGHQIPYLRRSDV